MIPNRTTIILLPWSNKLISPPTSKNKQLKPTSNNTHKISLLQDFLLTVFWVSCLRQVANNRPLWLCFGCRTIVGLWRADWQQFCTAGFFSKVTRSLSNLDSWSYNSHHTYKKDKKFYLIIIQWRNFVIIKKLFWNKFYGKIILEFLFCMWFLKCQQKIVHSNSLWLNLSCSAHTFLELVAIYLVYYDRIFFYIAS